MEIFQRLNSFLKTTTISLLVGLIAGLAAIVFLIALDWVTSTRDLHPQLILGLPVAGLLIAFIYQKLGQDSANGINQVIHEIQSPQKVLPLKFAPLIFLSTLASHLFGASVGREGTAVQMGSALSDQVSKLFNISTEERRRFLIAGAGAGFGAAIGVPAAGFIFGMEFFNYRKIKIFAWYESLIATIAALALSFLLKVNHLTFSPLIIDSFTPQTFLLVALAGIIFGLIVFFFVHLSQLIEKTSQRFIAYTPLRSFIGGAIILGFYYFEGSFRYTGLGVPEIQHAFLEASALQVPFLKLFFTALAIGVGFKGGEFTPLVFIGTTLGSALSLYLSLPIELLAALGFVAVFAGASKTPLASTIMAVEIFGIEIAPFALMVCFISDFVSGTRGIYKTNSSNP